MPDDEPLPAPGTVWYLPIFHVTQLSKDKIRLVFDAAARYQQISLNAVLLQEPDLNNEMRGVLLRFREKPIAFSSDVEAMFNNFSVPKTERNFLRFFWYRGNNPAFEMVAYRSCSHLFGFKSSPAVAIFGLKLCAEKPLSPDFDAAKGLIRNSFYMDDVLYSVDTPGGAIDIIRITTLVGAHNIKLHKIVCNSPEVMLAFPESECAVDISSLSLAESSDQRALGVTWDIISDSFGINIVPPDRDFTKRGVVSVNNTEFDPFGLVAPTILSGRLLQSELIPQKKSE